MSMRWRDRIFGSLATLISHHPRLVVLFAVALAAVSVAYSVRHWKFQSNRNLLISQKLEWNRRFIEVEEHFPGNLDLAVVIDPGEEAKIPGSKAYLDARRLAKELGTALRQSPRVKAAVWGADFTPRALRLAPMADFKARLSQIAESGLMLESPTPQALLSGVARTMMQHRDDQTLDDAKIAESIRELDRMIGAMGAVLEAAPEQPVDFGALVNPPAPGEEGTWQYLASGNGRLLFIRVTPKLDADELDALEPALNAIRAIVGSVAARHPGVEVGITGVGVMESEETKAATWDSGWTAALASVLITLLLVLAYHSWRTPLFLMIALLVGIAWAYGFLFLTVGHLQVLSVVFNIMLLGLGIAYGIYVASAFELLRHDHPDTLEGFRLTLTRTLQIMGPGVTTGALTTAFAFATTIFTDFTGVAEMGLIAGVGVLLCFVAIFNVFPALLRLFKPTHAHIASMEDRYIHFFEERWVMPFVRRPVTTLIVAAAVTALAVTAIFQMRFDYDLLKLQPRNAPSVLWAERVARDGGQSIWQGLSITDEGDPHPLETMRRRAEQFRKQPTVMDVGGVGLLFPADEQEKVKLIKETREQIEPALASALQPPPSATQPSPPPATPSVYDLLAGFRTLVQLASLNKAPAKISAAIANLDRTIARILTVAQGLTPAQRQQRAERLDAAYARFRHESAAQIAMALDPAPLGFDDLPIELMGTYRDDKGRLALEIYPNLAAVSTARNPITSPLDPRFLPTFVAQMLSVDAKLTGVVYQIYKSGILIKDAYQHAGLLALLVVFVIVYLDYRSLRDAMLILLPVAMAFAVTFGLMWLIGMQINAANIIVLPLMFGIGVDSGVHVLNRYRQNPDEQPVGLTHGTGKGITVTCMTSVISFAVMMLSSHRGIASLGFVLATGLTMTMLACWTVMPAWLELRRRARS